MSKVSPHEEKMLNLRMQMQHNNNDLAEYIKDLDSWEKDIKKKEKNIKVEETGKQVETHYWLDLILVCCANDSIDPACRIHT